MAREPVVAVVKLQKPGEKVRYDTLMGSSLKAIRDFVPNYAPEGTKIGRPERVRLPLGRALYRIAEVDSPEAVGDGVRDYYNNLIVVSSNPLYPGDPGYLPPAVLLSTTDENPFSG
jgi:hypothetical protein